LEVFGSSFTCRVAGLLKTSNLFFPIPVGRQGNEFAFCAPAGTQRYTGDRLEFRRAAMLRGEEIARNKGSS
jgi:hypothetical protein